MVSIRDVFQKHFKIFLFWPLMYMVCIISSSSLSYTFVKWAHTHALISHSQYFSHCHPIKQKTLLCINRNLTKPSPRKSRYKVNALTQAEDINKHAWFVCQASRSVSGWMCPWLSTGHHSLPVFKLSCSHWPIANMCTSLLHSIQSSCSSC